MGSFSRTGSLVIGIVEIIVYGLVLICSGLLYTAFELKKDEFLAELKKEVPDFDQRAVEWFPLFAIILVAFFAFLLISAIALVVGVKKSSTCLLKIWMIIKGLSDLIYIGLAVGYFFLGDEITKQYPKAGKPSIVPYICLAAALFIDAIFISIVCLFHRHLKSVELETKDYEESI